MRDAPFHAGTGLLLLLACALAPCAAGEEAPDGPPAAPPVGAPGPAAHTVRVATFNVWAIPLIAKDVDARLARLPQALAPLGLDVLCIQEAWLDAAKDRIQRSLAGLLPHAVRGGGGLMILSRHPIVSSKFVPFPRYEGLSVAEVLARKGYLEAVLAGPSGRLRIVTSHLALTFGPDNPRSRQLRFLLGRLEGKRDLPMVLAADLNTWPVSEGQLTDDYRAIVYTGLVDAKPPVRKHDQRWHPGPPTRIGWPRPEKQPEKGWHPDHIFFRSGAGRSLRLRAFRMFLDTQATALSDHNLLSADLEVRRDAARADAPAGSPGR